MTLSEYRKYRDISANPHVAFCLGSIQLEGMARNLGHSWQIEDSGIPAKIEEFPAIEWFMRYKKSAHSIGHPFFRSWTGQIRLFLDVLKEEVYLK